MFLIECIPHFLIAQNVTLRDRIKAELIYNFGINVTWKKDRKISRFKIGVLEKDSVMYAAIRGMCKYRLLKWKLIDVVKFNTVQDIKETQMLYVGYEFNAQINSIVDQIKDFHTLLITDSCHSSRTMINFFPPNSIKKVEVNEKNIKDKGLKILPFLWIIAKKYEEDWEAMYHNSEVNLQEEKEKVEQQSAILKQQQSEIERKKKNIDSLNTNIFFQQKELSNQSEKLAELQRDIMSKESDLIQKINLMKYQEKQILIQQGKISEQERITQIQQVEAKNQMAKLDIQKQEIKKGQKLIEDQKLTLNSNLVQIKKQQLILYFFVIVLVLIIGMIFFIYRSYKIKKKANHRLHAKNIEISMQKEEIETQRDSLAELNEELQQQKEEIVTQRDEIAQFNLEITDSIHYAKRIQTAILPPLDVLKNSVNEYFVLYKPRNIVSGDFYWIHKRKNKLIFAAVDCTGHGVPGAVMSMLGTALLNEIINNIVGKIKANEILNLLRENLILSLHQTGSIGESKDGMDIALCILDVDTNMLQFCGANNPCWIVSNQHCLSTDRSVLGSQQPTLPAGRKVANSQLQEKVSELTSRESVELIELKPNKMPIGIYTEEQIPFINTEIQLNKGDILYITSDGYVDQFGGPKGKKFKKAQLKKLLLLNREKTLEEQNIILEKEFYSWMGNLEQVDDVLVMGIRI